MKKYLIGLVVLVVPLLLFFGYMMYISFANRQFAEALKFYSMYSGLNEVSTAEVEGKTLLLTDENTAELCSVITRGSMYSRKMLLFPPSLEEAPVSISISASIQVKAWEKEGAEDTCILAYTEKGRTTWCTVSGLKTYSLLRQALDNGNYEITSLDPSIKQEDAEELALLFSDKMIDDGFYPAVRLYGSENINDTGMDAKKYLASLAQTILLYGKPESAECIFTAGYQHMALVRMKINTGSTDFGCTFFINQDMKIEKILLK